MNFSEERALFAGARMLPLGSVRVEPAPLRHRLRRLADNRWPVLAIVACAMLLGWGAIKTLPPMYQANLLVQVADPAGPPRSFLGDAGNAFDIKTPATAEIEILRSRMIVEPIVERSGLQVTAQPRYYLNLSPGEKIAVAEFKLPPEYEGEPFIATIQGPGRYTLQHSALANPVDGRVGEPLVTAIGTGQLTLLVSQLHGGKGTQFRIVRKPLDKAIEDLQDALKVGERGHLSGIIEASLRDTDPARAAAVLNAIGASYVKQAVDRKTSEADKAIAFLNTELPGLKQQMDRAEAAYNRFRTSKGTVSFDDDARMALTREYDLRNKLTDAQQKRREMSENYGQAHPGLRALDDEISGLRRELGGMRARISAMPDKQQDALRLERDVKVSTDMYQQLRNTALQLQLARQGMTGNTRLIDRAIVAHEPVWPKPAVVLGLSAFGAAVLSVLFVLTRSGLARGVTSAREIESDTGLNVYSSPIPFSRSRRAWGRSAAQVLQPLPHDVAVGLRQLRTLVQHEMRGRSNNRVLITGPTEGVGVRFIATNLGAIAALSGARTLLIDADRRRGSLHRAFGMASAPGMTDLMAGTCTRSEAIRPTGIPRLDLISAGTADVDIDGPGAARTVMELLEHASREYDMVLMTAPPVLSSSETLALALTGSMVVLVARARTTGVDDIAESARRLAQTGQVPSGVVLNGV
jgi:tyrosine-protein kinase Etk/Wzc